MSDLEAVVRYARERFGTPLLTEAAVLRFAADLLRVEQMTRVRLPDHVRAAAERLVALAG